MLFLEVFARVYANSPIGYRIEDTPMDIMSNEEFLVGCAAYPLSIKMLTPFKDSNTLTEKQRLYNFTQSSARCVVERAFGITKSRFRRLTFIDSEDIEKICLIIMAGCVLHNLSYEYDDNADEYLGCIPFTQK